MTWEDVTSGHSSTSGVVHLVVGGFTACTDTTEFALPAGESAVHLKDRDQVTCLLCRAWYEAIRRDR